jgi:UDP-N-acetylglucosamine--N-acetylmuramyl-(pentapeptide) pyrophosphoryl-undecaprenol N-acetylglucosamine transferase
MRRRGHRAVFVGTRQGLESRLVPAEDFPIEYIAIGGLKRVGLAQTLRTMLQLPVSVWQSLGFLGRYRPSAVFCMGGYVAGPPVIAAWLRRIPVVLMEPNAMPGMVNRYIARIAKKALLSFPEAAKFFPGDRVEMTGLPVRAEFYSMKPKAPGEKLTVLVTGGSRGSRRLNDAGRASWRLLRENAVPVRWIHQTGTQDFQEMTAAFADSGMDGVIAPFIENMPQVFSQADLVVCRSGAGAVSELAAAGKPSILVPFPHAADQHQLKNAEAMAQAGAARLVLDQELTGEELYHSIRQLMDQPGELERMGAAARRFAKPEAARRAVDIMEDVALGTKRGRKTVDSAGKPRNN